MTLWRIHLESICKFYKFLNYKRLIIHRELTEIMSTELKLVLFVILEHFLLIVTWLIHKAIPDRPSWVRIALAKADFKSQGALKREVN